MAKGYNFGSSVKRTGQIRHMKEINRGGLSVASTVLPGFVAGSSVRIRHRPGGNKR